MAEYIVTGVRKALSADATHRHISEVCTQGAIRFTRHEVIDSIREGNSWKTLADGHTAEIQIVEACPRDGCSLGPYIATNPDGTNQDNLEKLDMC
jgi:Protein of unknown function (DUF3892)